MGAGEYYNTTLHCGGKGALQYIVGAGEHFNTTLTGCLAVMALGAVEVAIKPEPVGLIGLDILSQG